MKRTLALLTVLQLAVLSLATPAWAEGVQVNGELTEINGFRALRVWGSPQEMGFAHGYLVGNDFVKGLNTRLGNMNKQERGQYEQFWENYGKIIDVPTRQRTELQWMLEGVKAANNGELPALKGLDRALSFEDLVVGNSTDLLRAFGCSGFTAWALPAGDVGVVTTRNFDYPITYPGMLEDQMILVRQPNGRHAVATITFPCYIGAFTGVNDEGVCTFMHDGSGDRTRQPSGRVVPVALVLTELLENSGAEQAQVNARELLKRVCPYPFSYMVRVVGPRKNGQKPERVFRVDATGLGENPVGINTSITTNHYLTQDKKPIAAGDWSIKRYDRLNSLMSHIQTAKWVWEAQNAVCSDDPGFPTLHTIVVYPERGWLNLAFASNNGGELVTAPKKDPTKIKFDQLFGSAK